MKPFLPALFLTALLLPSSADPGKPYRLEAVDLKQRVIWGVECLEPAGRGLALGGQDQDAQDGRPHTRLLVDGKWQPMAEKLRAGNPLQNFFQQTTKLRGEVKALRASMRALYFSGLPEGEEAALIRKNISPAQRKIVVQMYPLWINLAEFESGDAYVSSQIGFALNHLKLAGRTMEKNLKVLTADNIRTFREAQVHLELAAEAFDSEPAARALNCGGDAADKGLVYDPVTKLYVLFGGDHLDYLSNDTWVFDPAKSKWLQRHPQGAPPPRANHRMMSIGDGQIKLVGGYTYTSNTDYLGGQYADLNDREWVYDIAKNVWSGGELVPPDTRTYRSGPLHPDFYLQGDKPNAAAFEAKLKALPVNRWVTTDPPYRPCLNRDWGSAVIDPDRDLMLRWSGGHSAHGGTDVPHFHFSTNRWELPFPVEFPLGQLYSNTSYPRGFNFNRRPWMTGHTYQHYQYDLPTKRMVNAGRPRNHYLYDPELGDWVDRGEKPQAMCYNSCFYTLTLVSTPAGVHCWDKNGRVHRFDGNRWIELELAGEKTAGCGGGQFDDRLRFEAQSCPGRPQAIRQDAFRRASVVDRLGDEASAGAFARRNEKRAPLCLHRSLCLRSGERSGPDGFVHGRRRDRGDPDTCFRLREQPLDHAQSWL